MYMSEKLMKNILEAISSAEQQVLIQEFDFQTTCANQLLFFFKPGCFNVSETRYSEEIIEMAIQKLEEYHASIAGALLLSGTRLDELGIMDRHYGYINRLSKNASKALHQEDLQHISESLHLPNSIEDYLVLGGHEFLQKFEQYDASSLRDIWRSKHSHKLRSGFYFQEYDDIEGHNVILVNGFHPSQLAFFTNPTQKIVLFLINSDTAWHALKYDLVGDTFPENAKHDSIRGELFCHHEAYGLEEVTISNNIVHLSAGPFEAIFETYNFLHEIPASRFALKTTRMAYLMQEHGLSEEHVSRCLTNPIAEVDGKEIDLFTCTEDKNSIPAIEKYLKYFAG